MIIPSEIKIGEIKYVISQQKKIDNEKTLGQIIYRKCVIQLDEKLPKTLKNQTFIHECVHGILSEMSQNELNDDECFVNNLATLILQIIEQVK